MPVKVARVPLIQREDDIVAVLTMVMLGISTTTSIFLISFMEKDRRHIKNTFNLLDDEKHKLWKTHTGLKGSINLLLEEADIDKDGKIFLSEFRSLLRTASMSHLFEKVAIFFAVVWKHVAAVSTGLMKGEDGELSTDLTINNK
ncbi:calcium-dependent protein kinase 28-like protein [Tanacetum coccineum]|uniref:Calcium-dependent protein kinase 28-like protein n=1 Tax=Tanacetum coccineum TaxID=301880 RepID=A0ABQ5HFI0_9ASTR